MRLKKRVFEFTLGSACVFTGRSENALLCAVAEIGILPCTEPARARSVFEARTKLRVLTAPRPNSLLFTLVTPLVTPLPRALRYTLVMLVLFTTTLLKLRAPYQALNRS